MSADYATTIRRHRRLAILRFLADSPGYTSNESLITDVLNSDDIGIQSSRDQVRTEVQWLAEQGFATIGGSTDFMVAVATVAGVDVARGRAAHSDIQRPSPRR